MITLVKNTGEMLLFDIDVMNEASETVMRYSGYSLKQFRLTDRGSKEENQEVQIHDIRDRIRSYITDKLADKAANPSKLSLAKVHIMDLGIDSSQLIALTRELESATKIELNPTLFFEYPTLQELADFLPRNMKNPLFNCLEGSSNSRNPRI